MNNKKKVKVYSDSYKKSSRTPLSVCKDSVLELRQAGINKLLKMGISKKAYNFILENTRVSPNDELSRFRVSAELLKKTAENLKNSLTISATKEELKLKLILKELSINFEFQKIYFVGKSFYVVDFYLPEYNCVIEVDGCHHLNYDVIEYDRLRTENLIYIYNISKVIRFENKELSIDSAVKERLIKELRIKK